MRITADAQALKESLGVSELVPLSQNLVDVVLGSERPQRPKNTIFALDGKPYAVNSIVRDMAGKEERSCTGRHGRMVVQSPWNGHRLQPR
ncbi:hypothetical protein JVT61DRAFT_10047 [Boletus reticuloceps]|uniref:Uncharacterized protein n=1 Tax=Boletus reticuloceps TaxID=495285 RepID=A0A8I3ADL6_9AGAM|nr:hypothetical protein JVT61DRAFT_10047 [Boletus reticuloceps]